MAARITPKQEPRSGTRSFVALVKYVRQRTYTGTSRGSTCLCNTNWRQLDRSLADKDLSVSPLQPHRSVPYMERVVAMRTCRYDGNAYVRRLLRCAVPHPIFVRLPWCFEHAATNRHHKLPECESETRGSTDLGPRADLQLVRTRHRPQRGPRSPCQSARRRM